MYTDIIICTDIDGDEKEISCHVYPPRRASWSGPREPMRIEVQAIEPPLDRPLTEEEDREIFELCKSEMVDMELARRGK